MRALSVLHHKVVLLEKLHCFKNVWKVGWFPLKQSFMGILNFLRASGCDFLNKEGKNYFRFMYFLWFPKHNTVGRSKGMLGTHALFLGPIFFIFIMQFLGKNGQIIGWRSHLYSWCSLLWEILDPPLLNECSWLPTAYVVWDGRLCFQSVHTRVGGYPGRGRYSPQPSWVPTRAKVGTPQPR